MLAKATEAVPCNGGSSNPRETAGLPSACAMASFMARPCRADPDAFVRLPPDLGRSGYRDSRRLPAAAGCDEAAELRAGPLKAPGNDDETGT
jgi:hypothetical protein